MTAVTVPTTMPAPVPPMVPVPMTVPAPAPMMTAPVMAAPVTAAPMALSVPAAMADEMPAAAIAVDVMSATMKAPMKAAMMSAAMVSAMTGERHIGRRERRHDERRDTDQNPSHPVCLLQAMHFFAVKKFPGTIKHERRIGSRRGAIFFARLAHLCAAMNFGSGKNLYLRRLQKISNEGRIFAAPVFRSAYRVLSRMREAGVARSTGPAGTRPRTELPR